MQRFDLTTPGGVPHLRLDVPGPARAGLVVRTGTADETLATSGTTHLAEHLLLEHFSFGDDVGATTSWLSVEVTAEGEPDDVVGALRAVVAAAVDPPLHRVDDERRVLLTEEAGRGTPSDTPLVLARFGARTYGLTCFSDPGLAGADAESVARLLRTRVTRGTVGVWSTVPLPGDLLDPLPHGAPSPPPEPVMLPDLPGRVESDALLAFDTLVPRSAATAAALRLLREEVLEDLRRRHGLVYDVDLQRQRVGRDLRRWTLECDPLPEHHLRAAALLTQTVERLRRDGVDPDGSPASGARA